MELTKAVLKKIEKLTDHNQHGEARRFAAEKLGLPDLAQKFEAINQKHLRAGYLTMDLYEARSKLSQELMAHAKAALSPMLFRQFNNCF